MNETQLWFCDICDKTTDFNSRLRYINSKSHKHKKEYGTIVKEFEFNHPDIHEVNYILNDTIKPLAMRSINHPYTYLTINLTV